MDFQWNPNELVGSGASAALSDRVFCYGGFRFCITCATAFNARFQSLPSISRGR
jgi:hypothetical protein